MKRASLVCGFTICMLVILLSLPTRAFAAGADGAAVYQQHCAMCHDSSSDTHAPAPASLRLVSPEKIVAALVSGLMKDQGATLGADEKQAVAEFLTGKTIGETIEMPQVGLCANQSAPFSAAGPAWNGWGVDPGNMRFQPADQAGLTADQVPHLKLKWVFAYPDAFSANGQATVVGGRVFVPSANRYIYSLDAKSGCQYWSFLADTAVRSAIVVVGMKGAQSQQVAFFGDRRGNAYALDAATGQLLWKVRVDDANPRASIGAALAYYDGRLFVPMESGEEGGSNNTKVECCKSRGAVVALDAATGKVIWKAYTVPEDAHPVGKNSVGTTMWGPGGASIWSAPTLDLERKAIYVGTGNNSWDPPTNTSDAVLAFDMQSGKMLWSTQFTEGDSYQTGCHLASKAGCPPVSGPDFDIGASPILVKLPNGKRVLLVGQKSGLVHGVDPDNKGAILWEQRVGRGGTLGGIQWGPASDGRAIYAAVSDLTYTKPGFDVGEKRFLNPNIGGGLIALNVATGEKIWAAPPPSCGNRPACSPAQSAAVSVIPGVVFSGSVDGHLRGYSTTDGKVIWDFDTAREYATVDGITAQGGSIDCPGPTIAGGMVYVNSGYGIGWGLPGNVLLAFSVDGK